MSMRGQHDLWGLDSAFWGGSAQQPHVQAATSEQHLVEGAVHVHRCQRAVRAVLQIELALAPHQFLDERGAGSLGLHHDEIHDILRDANAAQ